VNEGRDPDHHPEDQLVPAGQEAEPPPGGAPRESEPATPGRRRRSAEPAIGCISHGLDACLPAHCGGRES
jgi:hypothetical protein